MAWVGCEVVVERWRWWRWALGGGAAAWLLEARVFGAAPRAALLFNLSLSVLIPVLAYDLGRRLAGRITGFGGALLLVLSPFLVMAFSMESYLYVTLILASMDARKLIGATNNFL